MTKQANDVSELSKRNERQAHSSAGVFKEHFDKRCSFDRVVGDIWGRAHTQIGNAIAIEKNVPIGGPWRPYARMAQGRLVSTGNPVDIKYGKFQKQQSRKDRVAPFRILMRCGAMPLTYSQLVDAADAVADRGSRILVNLAEMTFDTTMPFELVLRDLFVTTRYRRDFENGCWRTCYCGSPRSGTQLRIYEKCPGVTRVEFVLRAPALRELGVEYASELLKLRTADLSHVARWLELDAVATAVQLGRNVPDTQLQACLALHRRNTAALEKLLRTEYRVCTSALLRPARLQDTLREMQTALIW